MAAAAAPFAPRVGRGRVAAPVLVPRVDGLVHADLRRALEEAPQRVDALLLLLRRREVRGEEHLQHRLHLRPVVLGGEQELTRARAVQAQQRGGVLQGPLHLRALLDVVHPDHRALLERAPDRPRLRRRERHLRGQSAVGQRHPVRKVRRARGDESASRRRDPALREREAERVAQVHQRGRVRVAQARELRRDEVPHGLGGAELLAPDGVEPVLLDASRDEIVHLPEVRLLVVQEHLDHGHGRAAPRRGGGRGVFQENRHRHRRVHLTLNRARQPRVLHRAVAAHAGRPLRPLKQKRSPRQTQHRLLDRARRHVEAERARHVVVLPKLFPVHAVDANERFRRLQRDAVLSTPEPQDEHLDQAPGLVVVADAVEQSAEALGDVRGVEALQHRLGVRADGVARGDAKLSQDANRVGVLAQVLVRLPRGLGDLVEAPGAAGAAFAVSTAAAQGALGGAVEEGPLPVERDLRRATAQRAVRAPARAPARAPGPLAAVPARGGVAVALAVLTRCHVRLPGGSALFRRLVAVHEGGGGERVVRIRGGALELVPHAHRVARAVLPRDHVVRVDDVIEELVQALLLLDALPNRVVAGGPRGDRGGDRGFRGWHGGRAKFPTIRPVCSKKGKLYGKKRARGGARARRPAPRVSREATPSAKDGLRLDHARGHVCRASSRSAGERDLAPGGGH